MLWDNILEGSIPNRVYYPQMKWFDLASNYFNGPLPDYEIFGNCSYLTNFIIHENHFTGEFTNLLINCQQLTVMETLGNDLTGIFPQYLLHLALLTSMAFGSVYRSTVHGTWDTIIDSFQQCDLISPLVTLTIEGTSTSSSLFTRSWFWSKHFPNLIALDLSNSLYTGPIPTDLCNLTIYYGYDYLKMTFRV